MNEGRGEGARRIVTAEDVLRQARDGRFLLRPGDVLTPLVRETAERHAIALVPAEEARPADGVLLWQPEGADATARLRRRVEAGGAGIAAVAVPFPWVTRLRASGPGTWPALAVYSVAAWDAGAYTGEVSARMAVDAGASAVILGLPGARRLPRIQREWLPRQVAKALAAGLTPYVGVSLADEDFEAVRTFSLIREAVMRVLEAAGDPAQQIRWFWCHPGTRPARLANPGEYLDEIGGALRARGQSPEGRVGWFDESSSRSAQAAGGALRTAFRVERIS